MSLGEEKKIATSTPRPDMNKETLKTIINYVVLFLKPL
jgi:hypothetical protein